MKANYSEILGAIVVVLAVTGVILNNRKLISCFYFWTVTNSICAYLHWTAGMYALTVRDLVFLILAFEGWYRWRSGGLMVNRKGRIVWALNTGLGEYELEVAEKRPSTIRDPDGGWWFSGHGDFSICSNAIELLTGIRLKPGQSGRVNPRSLKRLRMVKRTKESWVEFSFKEKLERLRAAEVLVKWVASQERILATEDAAYCDACRRSSPTEDLRVCAQCGGFVCLNCRCDTKRGEIEGIGCH